MGRHTTDNAAGQPRVYALYTRTTIWPRQAQLPHGWRGAGVAIHAPNAIKTEAA